MIFQEDFVVILYNFSTDMQKRQFIKKKGEFEVMFSVQEQLLKMQLICQESLLFYELTIDGKYIENNSDMSTLFSSPRDLLYTLEQLFDQLDISQKGTIALKIRLNAAKINMTKTYSFQMSPSTEGQLQFLRARVRQNKEDIARKHSQIQQLRSQKGYLQKELSQIQSLKQKYDSLVKQSSQKERQNQSIINELQQNLNKTRSEKDYFQKQLKNIRQLNQKQAQANQITKNKQLLYQEKMASGICQMNPQMYHFHYKYSTKGIKIVKKTENGWSNWISGWIIPEGKTTEFMLNNFKMRDGTLAIGIGSQAVFNNFSLEHQQYVSYLCRDGRIYEYGLKRMNGIPLKSNQSVKICINRNSSTISWKFKENQIGAANISNTLNTKKLYLIVKVFWKDDEFQLSF